MLSEPGALQPIVQALGWALLHSLWQGALLGGLHALGMLILRQASPQLRYGFGLACLAVLVVLPVATFLALLPRPALPAVALPAPGAGVGTAVAGEVAAVGGLAAAMPWIVGAWVSGALVQAVRVLLAWLQLRRLARRGVGPAPPWLLQRAGELRARLGVRRPVRLLESALVEVPTVLGWFKPVILLPTACLTGLSPRQLELIVAHELGHVRRWDYLVNLLQICAETVLFYHPVLRSISRRIREDREQCCDDLVVARCGDALDYARALAVLERLRSRAPLAAPAATGGRLAERIERIAGDRSRERALAGGHLAPGLVLVLAAVLAARLAAPLGQSDRAPGPALGELLDELLLASAAGHAQRIVVPLDRARALVQARPAPGPGAAREATAAAREAAPAADGPGRRRVHPVPAPAQEPAAPRRPGPQAPSLAAPDDPPASPHRSGPPARPASPRSVRASAGEEAMPPPAAASPPGGAGPRIVERHAPIYPVRARTAGLSGTVLLSFVVDAEGRPRDIEIEEARPRRVFERASLRALRQWRFRPGSAAGIGRLSQRFDFSLAGDGEAGEPSAGECLPITGTRICRNGSATALLAREAHSR